MKKINIIYLGLIFLTSLLVSCGDDDDVSSDVEIPNEEEVITTLNYTLISSDGTDTVTLSFLDADVDGPLAPVITNGIFQNNTTYTGVIELLNETENPGEDITPEIQEEDDEHQFFFIVTGVDDLIIEYSDEDDNGNPLGLQNTITTGNIGSGEIQVILRHEPVKDAIGVSDGDITNAGGSTDIEATFPITIN